LLDSYYIKIYCAHIRLYKSYIDEPPTIPHIADNNKV